MKNIKIIMLGSADWQKIDQKVISKDEIEETILNAANEAIPLLAKEWGYLSIIVKPNLPHVSKIDGVGGSTFDSELIDITFDSTIPRGALDMKKLLREAIFHELNHSVRYRTNKMNDNLVDNAITEGLATVFERDYANATSFYMKYENDETMMKWFEDLKNATTDGREWYVEHPDGRTKIVYRTGTWIIDKAMQNSDLTCIDLTQMSVDEILTMAKLSKSVK